MKKLILAIVIGLALGLPASSFAGVNAMGVKLPINNNEQGHKVESGFIPETAAGSYQSQKLGGKTTMSPSIETPNASWVLISQAEIK